MCMFFFSPFLLPRELIVNHAMHIKEAKETQNNGSQPLDSFSFGLSSFILDTDNIGFQCLDAKLSDRCEKLPEKKTLLCLVTVTITIFLNAPPAC